jgi:hypothetical protein
MMHLGSQKYYGKEWRNLSQMSTSLQTLEVSTIRGISKLANIHGLTAYIYILTQSYPGTASREISPTQSAETSDLMAGAFYLGIPELRFEFCL